LVFYNMSKCFATSPNVLHQRTVNKLSVCLLLSMVILLLGGGVALLWEFQQGNTAGRAAGDVSVIGPPTVSATTVDAIFARLGSPMVGTGKIVELASRQANIDDAFALGVWWTETNDGAAGVGLADRNPGSVRGSVGYPSAFDGYTIYPSYTAAIQYWFKMIRNNYVIGRGISTVYTIARPYVGTTSYPLWAGKVINLIYKYRGMAPPPPVVTATPKPKPTTIASVLMKSRSGRDTHMGEAQENPRQAATPPVTRASQLVVTPVLPRQTEFGIVLSGLLAALAIALYGLRLNRKLPIAVTSPGQRRMQSVPAIAPLSDSSAPVTDQLAHLAGDVFLPVEPSTENLPSVPQLDFPGRITQTEVLVLSRGRMSLPARAGAATHRTPVESSTFKRPVGLLSGYRENNS
jgi:hypothetical protein